MDVLKGMNIFCEVANQRGFAPAARSLNLSTSAVSRYVMDLEAWLGVQLFQRTTRSLSLTVAGSVYLDRCQRVITEVEEIQSAAIDQRVEPQGLLRATAPVFVAKNFLQEVLPEYFRRYPKVELDLLVSDRFIDLVGEGFDVAVRAGVLEDSSLIARRLADGGLVLIAAPGYLEEHGAPENVEALNDHNCLVDTAPGYGNRWPLSGDKKQKSVTVSGNFRVNSGELVRELAIAGQGIALLPRFMVARDISDGALVTVLEGSVTFKGGIYAVYPKHRHVSPSVRSFVNFLESKAGELNAL